MTLLRALLALLDWLTPRHPLDDLNEDWIP